MRVSNTIIESHSSQYLGIKKLVFSLMKTVNSLTIKWTSAKKKQYLNAVLGVHWLWILYSRKNSFYSLVNHSFHYWVCSENEVENIWIPQYDLRLEKRVHMSLCPRGLIISILFPVGAAEVISAAISKGLKAFNNLPQLAINSPGHCISSQYLQLYSISQEDNSRYYQIGYPLKELELIYNFNLRLENLIKPPNISKVFNIIYIYCSFIMSSMIFITI